MRVLVVEDDKDLKRQLVTALSDSGYAVDSAGDGEEGYFLGDTEPYDVVILDLGLPKMDGISILEQWRRYSSTLGRSVRIWQKDKATEGIAVDLSEDGGLIVRIEGERQIVVHAGDVEHLTIL